MTNEIQNINNSYGKMYMGFIMATLMVLGEVYMHDSTYNVVSYKLYGLFIALSLLLIYIYRSQLFINDEQYLKEMIEHHSMALLTSNKILEKTNNYDVAKLAKNIIQTQTDEIDYMNKVLEKIKG